MSYTINLTNGTTLIPGGLSDGTVNTSATSLTLIGKDYAGYGQFLNENFVKLLENFSSTSQPSNPLKGQLWWDASNNILKVYSGTSWKISTGATSAPFSAPPGDLSALGGDLWWDTTNAQLKVYSGSTWVTVGPQATSVLQTTGAFAATISDSASASRKVIQLQFNGVVYAIFAYETFTTTIPGFETIKAGLNFRIGPGNPASPAWQLNTQSTAADNNTLVQRDSSGGITVNAINGTTLNAATITATNAINGTFNGNVTGNVTATTVSASTVSASGVTASSGYTGSILTAAQPNITSLGTLTSLNVSGPVAFSQTPTINGLPIATIGGASTSTFIDGQPIGGNVASSGKFTTLQVTSSISPAANLTINNGVLSGGWWNALYANTGSFASTVNASGGVIATSFLPATANVTNIGSTTQWFNNIYGRSIQALYADLAERFHSDAEYPAGTVVEMGGVNEITKVVEECSERVFGVISTNAAYLMNSGAGDDVTHPPIAMSGRVPVRVTGKIAKGDRLVSAGNGLARAGLRSELTPFNVIGRALENKTTANEGVIEAIVKLNS